MMKTKNSKVLLLSFFAVHERVFSYLGGRSIDLQVFFDRRSLLQVALRENPSAVFLSVNFPDSLLSEIEKILTPVLHNRIIYFSEDDSVGGSARLANYKSKNKVYGSLSGPAIERSVINLTGDPKYFTSIEQKTNIAGSSKMRMNMAFTMIQRRVHDILDGQVRTVSSKIQSVDQFHCYRAYFDGVSHTFVLATAESATTARTEIIKVAQIIRSALEEQGFKIQDDSLFQADTEDFALKDWFNKKKLNFFTTYNRGYEWTIGFCLDSRDGDISKDSRDPQMYVISTDSFASGQSVDFDLYVYFKSSGRYVLLVPRKSKLTPGTFQALQKNDVSSLHIFKDDRHRARKYLFEKKIRHVQMNFDEVTQTQTFIF